MSLPVGDYDVALLDKEEWSARDAPPLQKQFTPAEQGRRAERAEPPPLQPESAGPVVELSPSELPAFCPNPTMPLWSSHPRVFLDVVNEREAMCPYCGTRYRLMGNRHIEHSRFDAAHLNQHRAEHAPESAPPRTSVARDTHPRETPNMTADALGNTSLELMTQWLKRR